MVIFVHEIQFLLLEEHQCHLSWCSSKAEQVKPFDESKISKDQHFSMHIKDILLQTRTTLTHLGPTSFLWDMGKQNSSRQDAAKRGVPSRLFCLLTRISSKMK